MQSDARFQQQQQMLMPARASHLANLLSTPDTCLMRNILQIWDSDVQRIRALDQQQVLNDVNAALESR